MGTRTVFLEIKNIVAELKKYKQLFEHNIEHVAKGWIYNNPQTKKKLRTINNQYRWTHMQVIRVPGWENG